MWEFFFVFYSRYQRTILARQRRDKSEGKGAAKFDLPASYVSRGEPVPQAGVAKGLSLVLDAHTDKLSSGSVSEDFRV